MKSALVVASVTFVVCLWQPTDAIADERATIMEDREVRFPVLVDDSRGVKTRYFGRNTSLPSSFLLDAQGRIVLMQQGYYEHTKAELTAEVEKLVGC